MLQAGKLQVPSLEGCPEVGGRGGGGGTRSVRGGQPGDLGVSNTLQGKWGSG